MLQKICENIWTCDSELSLLGAKLGARMTVVDLDGRGNLFVHSPVKLSGESQSQLNSLGTVRFVVAPNKWHHLFIPDMKSKYPDAKYFAAPGLDKKKSDFAFDGVVTAAQTFPWNMRLKHLIVEGCPIFNEVVFFDSESRTLILTDLAIHICDTDSLYTKIILTILGSFKKFGWSNIEKKIYIRDMSLFKRSIEEIVVWILTEFFSHMASR